MLSHIITSMIPKEIDDKQWRQVSLSKEAEEIITQELSVAREILSKLMDEEKKSGGRSNRLAISDCMDWINRLEIMEKMFNSLTHRDPYLFIQEWEEWCE